MVDHSYVNHILVPVDVADSFKLPLEYVRLFAERFETKVTLLYAENIPMVGPVIAYPPLTEEVNRELERDLRAYAGDALRTIDFQTAILPGNPAFAIPAASRKYGADLIIMGTHGRRGWRRALVGSVAESVLHAVACPVLVVPERRGIEHPAAAITRVVCPINFSDVARDALRTAQRIAQAFDAELIAVHVVEGCEEPDMSYLNNRFRRWIQQAIGRQCSFRELLLRGGPAERVLDCVDDFAADLLVMGAQQKRLSNETVIGSTSERLIRFASVPVLSIVRGLAAAAIPDVVPAAASAAR